YCVRDTVLPLDILDRLQSVARKEALASVSLTTVETASSGTTSQWLDSLAIRLADRRNVSVPTTNSGPRRRNQIAGGYVHEVDAGLEPWVVVLDFKSMYPSIMIANNICFTTLLRDGSVDDSHSVSPTTETRYLSKEDRLGLVPQLLEQLMQSREVHKAALSVARESGDEAEAFLQDQLQYAVKILMNSFYGVFASSFYRFTHPDLGASITEWARHNIRGIIAHVEKRGHEVVYSDTDSIFVKAPVDKESPINKPPEDSPVHADWERAKAETLRFGESLASEFTKEGAELELETALSAFFSHGAKKRYVGRVVWPREEMLIRGYEVRRTDSFALLTRTMTEMFEMILDGEEWAAVEMTKSVIDDVKARRVDAADLVISRSCKGTLRRDGTVDFSKVYDNPNGLPYVRAAKKRIERDLPFTPGMKVGYVVTSAKNSPMDVEPWLVDEIGEDPPRYDPDYYARRLATALGRITEAFGWGRTELMSGSRQQTLFDF
ncbi:MAG: DNA polymerase domain-containing protein, partial [Candidatus Thalassarchaeum sp.]|nr:DNA polymerase domain-containing protein [Candidatus Thalassarchaeum sp.]